jgi:hypothetical protein
MAVTHSSSYQQRSSLPYFSEGASQQKSWSSPERCYVCVCVRAGGEATVSTTIFIMPVITPSNNVEYNFRNCNNHDKPEIFRHGSDSVTCRVVFFAYKAQMPHTFNLLKVLTY